MTWLEQQGEAIRQRAIAWASASLGSSARLELPNQDFSEPAADASNPLTSAHAELTILGAGAFPLGLGGYSTPRRHLGRAVLSIYVPRGTGDALALALAEAAADQFRGVAEAGIVYQEPEFDVLPQPEGEQQVWWGVQVDIPFYQDYTPGVTVEQLVYPTLEVNQAAHGLAAGEAVHNNAGTWTKAVATAEATLAEALVVSVPDADTLHIGFGPTARVPAHGLGAAGTELYLSQSTAGAMVSIQPTSGIVQLVATVIDADRLRIHDRGGEIA